MQIFIFIVGLLVMGMVIAGMFYLIPNEIRPPGGFPQLKDDGDDKLH